MQLGLSLRPGGEGECSGMRRMRVCLILVGDKLLAAPGTLMCNTDPSPSVGGPMRQIVSNCVKLIGSTVEIYNTLRELVSL